MYAACSYKTFVMHHIAEVWNVASTINQQIHLYNFHLKHVKHLKPFRYVLSESYISEFVG